MMCGSWFLSHHNLLSEAGDLDKVFVVLQRLLDTSSPNLRSTPRAKLCSNILPGAADFFLDYTV